MGFNFMVKSKQTGACYCGKCGKRQTGSLFYMYMHAKNCGLEAEGVEVVDEGSAGGYCLDSAPNALILRIYAPQLIVIQGVTDRFGGMKWRLVFEAIFPVNSKCPVISMNEIDHEMDVLLQMIRADRILPLSEEYDLDVIRRVFNCIDIYSLPMFVSIYKNRGYYSSGNHINATIERWMLENTLSVREWKNLELYSRRKHEMNQKLLSSATARTSGGHKWQEKIPVYVTLYIHQTKKYILKVILRKDGEQIVFLFTRGYCSCNARVSLWELLDEEYYLIGNSLSAILKYDKAYPEYHLASYVMRSENILIPLLAGEYHTGIELAAKCGATGVAEGFKYLTGIDEDPDLHSNLRDMFGVPAWVLRALKRRHVCDKVIERLKEIFDYCPSFLQFDSYTDSMVEFYLRADITHSGVRGFAGDDLIEGTDALSDKQILQILRYLKKHPDEDEGHYYCDYLNACAQLGEYLYGITPKISPKEAHDRTAARINDHHDIQIRALTADNNENAE